MEITTRDLFTVLHGMGFGTLFMLAFSGALAQLNRFTAPGHTVLMSKREQSLLAFYLVTMVVFAWSQSSLALISSIRGTGPSHRRT